MEKSANKRWRESGSTLTFREWIDRDNKKKESKSNFVPFDANANAQYLKEEIMTSLQNAEDNRITTKPDSSKILGLNKTVFIFSTVLLIGSLTYYFINRAKHKK